MACWDQRCSNSLVPCPCISSDPLDPLSRPNSVTRTSRLRRGPLFKKIGLIPLEGGDRDWFYHFRQGSAGSNRSWDVLSAPSNFPCLIFFFFYFFNSRRWKSDKKRFFLTYVNISDRNVLVSIIQSHKWTINMRLGPRDRPRGSNW